MTITVKDGSGNSQNLATGSGDGAGNPYFSPAATALGTTADAAVTNPGSSASVIAALKGLLTNLPATLGPTNSAKSFSITFANDIAAIPAPVPSVFTGATLTRSANNGTAYAFGQVVFTSTASSQSVTQTIQAAKAVNQASTILRGGLLKSGTSTTNAIFRVHLFNAQPTLINGDNGTWLSTLANWVGSIDITVDKIGSDKAVGIGVPTIGSTIANTPVSGQNYYYYEIETRGAYAPGQGETFIPWLEVQ